jgi:hypothetical protein
MLSCHDTWYSMQSCAVKWGSFFYYLRWEVSVAMRKCIVISWVMIPCTRSLVDEHSLVKNPLPGCVTGDHGAAGASPGSCLAPGRQYMVVPLIWPLQHLALPSKLYALSYHSVPCNLTYL